MVVMRFLIIAVVIVLAAAFFGLFRSQPTTEEPVLGSESATDSSVAWAPVQSQPVESGNWMPPEITYETYRSEYGALPASLEGTQIPVGRLVDDNGDLIIDENLRRFFDYFFTLDGEEPHERIIARIEELLKNILPLSAQSRALEILYQYVELKKEEIALAARLDADFKASGVRADIGYLKRQIRDLRASNLDPEVYEGFFGEEERHDEYTISRIEIQQDQSLTEAEKAEALKALEQYLPEADRRYLAEERELKEVYEAVAAAKAQGASEAEIFHLRAQAFGPEAAERYSVADKEMDAWDARVATYREQRKAILETDGYSEADKDAEIQALRAQHFEGNELKRIPVIDNMMDAEK